MGFSFSTSDISLNNPHPAGQDFVVSYLVTNTGGADGGHVDHVDVWDIHSTKVVDRDLPAPASDAGMVYGIPIEIPALTAGDYDIAITIAGGAASAGATIVVQ